ncbi:survival motor neuron-like protein, putative [Plasmodium gallinaceum]|uniref:Survival motor neuron-like protein, putative n=1 Tax=Plasmodium gallinaceum TaxID=5849 RepID=A0A1J1GSD6_PLAGA|nr:survival motor neuron-like protein, putative [Plasmodium gallinaceum]CRG94224.1 survival motor neuron-like protein, putative [Plasmodium gallinaceum]
MDDFNETLEGLEEKISEYEKQLTLVRDEIKKYEQIEDQENEQLKNLKKLECDMLEVINLTRDLIKYKKQNEIENDEANELEKNEENQIQNINENITESNGLIGRTCSFIYENKKIYGLIENLIVEKNVKQLIVHIFETNEKITIPKDYVHLNEILDESALSENNQFQALYKKDGHWYDCIISKSKGDSYLITYIGYNNSEYVKNDQVRIKKKKKIKEIITPAGYKIPENLIIKENDSLKVKMKKKKKRIALKKKQKNELINKEFANKTQQWRSFHEKALSKSKHLLIAHKKVENIENNNNPSNFNIRRKFDYNDNDE